MAFSNKLSFTIIFLFCIFLHNYPLKSDGVTIDLIPRDASKSYSDRLKSALERSSQRLQHFSSSVLPNNVGGSKIQTNIIRGGGSYIMNISLGTPPVTLLGIADTGSELVWTQCLPCTNCYKQNLPFYDPKKSSTFKKLSCSSDACSTLQQASCNRSTSTCTYSYLYGDQSHTKGDLASETFRIGNAKSAFKSLAFGCAHDTAGIFDSSASGLVGLSPASLSLVNQLDEKKFSYCLQPFSSNASSKISFGSDASVSGSGVAKTPLESQNQKTFYLLTLEGVSVGGTRIDFQGSTIGDEGGNIIIDSGTTLTYLPTDFRARVSFAVEKAISADKVPSLAGLSPCYSASGNIDVDFTVHFSGGDVKLSPVNLFVQVNEETVCFALTDAGSNISIYGNIIQSNFLVGYDLDAGAVSFLRKDCTKA